MLRISSITLVSGVEWRSDYLYGAKVMSSKEDMLTTELIGL